MVDFIVDGLRFSIVGRLSNNTKNYREISLIVKIFEIITLF